ncbi:MAG: O-antigen ligase family protein [Acidobacteria bacterium]|nr:O-antigen ligase family protein [Acidobacteriota bacterium]
MPLRAVLILAISFAACLLSLRKPFWGLCFFALITYIRPERFSYNYLADFHIPLIVSICLVIGWLFQYRNFYPPERSSWTVLSLFGLSFILILASFFAEYSVRLSFMWAEELFKIAIFCFLMVRLIDTKERLSRFVGINLFGAAFLGIWGFEQHFRGNPRLEDMAGGQFSESNSMAALWVLMLPLFIAIFFKKGIKYKLMGGLLSCVLLSSIVFTQSRAAILGLAVVAFILFLMANLRLKIGLLAAAAIMYLVFSWAASGTPGYHNRMDSIFNEEETGGRYEIWEVGFEMFKDHPFLGVGAQNFQYMAKDYFIKLNKQIFFKQRADPHNTALLFLCEGGIFALLFYLLSIFLAIRDLLILNRLSRTNPSVAGYRPFIWALASGLLGFLVCAMLHSYPVYEVFYWCLVIPSIGKNIYYLRLAGKQSADKNSPANMPIDPVPTV